MQSRSVARLLPMLAPLAACAACASPDPAPVALRVQPVIYGADDREELIQQDDPRLHAAARAVLALVEHPYASVLQGAGDEDAGAIGRRLSLCPDEAFTAQPSLARCTGFLLGPDLLVTAGHCFDSADDCGRYVYAEGFALDRDGSLAPGVVARSCAAPIVREVGMLADGSTVDYAFVRLEAQADAVALAPSETLPEAGERVRSLGFPEGRPIKVDPNGRIAEAGRVDLRVLTDAFDGSSGSPLLDAELRVAGLLVRGQRDYVTDSAQPCLRANRVREDAGIAELAMRLDVALARACHLSGASDVCALDRMQRDVHGDAASADPPPELIPVEPEHGGDARDGSAAPEPMRADDAGPRSMRAGSGAGRTTGRTAAQGAGTTEPEGGSCRSTRSSGSPGASALVVAACALALRHRRRARAVTR